MVLLALLATAGTIDSAPEPTVDIPAGAVELLLDDHAVSSMVGLSRRLIRPRPHESNPRLLSDLPWEAKLVTMVSPLWDEAEQKHRIWYLASPNGTGLPAGPYPPTGEYPVAYAESADTGVPVNLTKPMIGHPYGPYAETNLVIPDSHSWTVVKDDAAPPEQRFKGVGGWRIGISQDGITWTVKTWSINMKDTSPALFRFNGQWVALGRALEPRGPNNKLTRRVTRATAEDFWDGPWTTPEVVPSLDTTEAEGMPWVQPYSVAVNPWGNQLIGLLRLIDLDVVGDNNTLGDTYAVLVTSRDGLTWTRVAGGAPFMVADEHWNDRNIVPPAGFYTRGDKMIFVYTASPDRHGTSPQDYSFGVATLPADRFQAIEGTGTLTTKPLDIGGEHLVVNATGGVKVAVIDQEGFAESDMIVTPLDDLRQQIDWTGGTLGDLEKPVKLRFTIGNIDRLFGFLGS